jgi:hypothetical protein
LNMYLQAFLEMLLLKTIYQLYGDSDVIGGWPSTLSARPDQSQVDYYIN